MCEVTSRFTDGEAIVRGHEVLVRVRGIHFFGHIHTPVLNTNVTAYQAGPAVRARFDR